MSEQVDPTPAEGKAVQPFTPQEANVMLERTGVNPAMWRMMTELAKQCIVSGAFPSALTNPAKALVVMQAGVELGMKPMQAVQSMFFINGKLAMYSSALLAMMKKNGLVVKWKTLTAEKVVGEFSALNQPPVEISFGKDDAVRAGLTGGNYTKYPQDMFVARCVSRAAKLFPDLIGTPIETTEVMDDVVATDAQVSGNVPTKLLSPKEKSETKKAEKAVAAAIPNSEKEAAFMGKPEIAEIIEEMKCAETEEDFEGVRQMIVGKPWGRDEAIFLGDKFMFYKNGGAKQQPAVDLAEAAKDVFPQEETKPAATKKTRSERFAELANMKSVDLKPILAQYEIDFSGMLKEDRVNAILGYEYPPAEGSEPTPHGYVDQDQELPPPPNDPVDSLSSEAEQPSVLKKLFDSK